MATITRKVKSWAGQHDDVLPGSGFIPGGSDRRYTRFGNILLGGLYAFNKGSGGDLFIE